jgi:hypothetical protein
MKTILRLVFFAIIALNTTSALAGKSEAKGTNETTVSSDNKTTSETKLSKEDMDKMVARLHEIRDMNTSTLTADEKHDLRKEVVAIKEKMHKSHPGYIVFISTTTLIIILLILLLI